MRLLKLEDNGEFSLTEFVGDNVPRYAVLSHTWGADHEEVTFKDITEGTGKTKAGYRKIQFCGKQAVGDDLQYFWVDTCCIDKSSSAELAEAINSMFRWYHDAATCYVYLSDVSISGFARDDSSFPKSKWFTRGWTLQELLAPTSVQFFSAEGKRLGDRTSLVQEIAKITSISVQALQGHPLSHFSVDERMLWAGGRKTKREEDSAYSLLGIFNIHMPLIYGEGRRNAFNRLHKEIKESMRNRPQALPSSILSEQLKRKYGHFSTVPFGKNSQVVELSDTLEQIETYRKFEVELRHAAGQFEDMARHQERMNAGERTRPRLRNDFEVREESSACISGSPGGEIKDKNNVALQASITRGLCSASSQRGKFTNQVEPVQNAVHSLYKLAQPTNPELQPLRRLVELRDYEDDEQIQEAFQLFLNIQRLQRLQSQNAVYDWLDTATFAKQYNTDQYHDKQVSSRLEGTCEWIFSHPAYSAWISENASEEVAKILWICAPGGYGKTILCTRLVEHLQGQWPFHVASWIAQIVQFDTDIFESVRGLSKAGQRASDSTIWSILESIVSQNRNYTFVLDGFDEYSRLNEVRAEFLQRLKKTIKRTVSRVLVLSRDETDIKAELCPNMAQRGVGYVTLQCRISKKDVQDDISLFSKSVVDKKLPKKDDYLRQSLAEQLVEKCEGMFLWIKLQQDQLRSGKNAKQLRNIVRNMPSGLYKTYERNWKTIQNKSPEEQNRARAILKWTTFAVRPLTISEITEALIVEPNEDGANLLLDELPDDIDDEYVNSEIIDICGALVEVRIAKSGEGAGSGIIHLIHPSVREFLLSTLSQTTLVPSNQSLTIKTPGQTEHHKYIATICLAYLNCNDIWQRYKAEDSKFKCTFVDYAARHWNSHMTAAGKDNGELISLVKRFLRPKNGSFHQWRAYIEFHEATAEDGQERERAAATPLYYAALFDLTTNMEYIWAEDKSQLNTVGGEYGTPLQAACFRGHNLAFDLLIRWGADPNIEGGKFGVPINAAIAGAQRSMVKALVRMGANLTLQDSMGRTPLYTAAKHGNRDIVDLLIEVGAELKTTNKYKWTPLNSASDGGHLEVVKLLLEKGADVRVATNSGWTPLNTASDGGHLEVVKLLLEKGADVGVATNNGWTPLNTASDSGHLEVVKLLLENGADIGAANNDGRTPLNSASNNGHLEVVKLLLENGADVGVATHNNGWTPLNSASDSGHFEVVKLLLEKGADVGVATNDGWTPLNLASNNGHLEIVKLLFEKGADVGVATNGGWTPLNLACLSGYLKIVKLLLEKGADVGVANNSGWTPLNSASNSGHLEVVKLLLEKGADIGAANNNGRTPLNSASDSGHLEVAKLLLEKGADVGVATHDHGWTPLNSASDSGHFEVVKLLLEKGADIGAANNSGWTPLNTASNNGHLEVVKLLLEKGADVGIATNNGWTPLNSASDSGHLEVVKLLLEKGADVRVATHDHGWTPLNSASNHGHLEVIKLLLEKGADVGIATNNGWTPLNSASDSGHLEVVKLLLEKGADVRVATNNGWTPLNSASNHGHLEVAKLLLEKGADIGANNGGWTPLNLASDSGHLEVVKLLLEKGADIGATNNGGRTPLDSASNHGHLEVVKLLLDKAVDVNYLSGVYGSTLHLLAHKGYTDILHLALKKYSMNPHPMDTHGRSALHLAARGGHIDTYNFLISLRLDTKTSDEKGDSLVHYASSGGSLQVLNKVLDEQSVSAPRSGHWSPLHWACRGGNPRVVERLLQEGSCSQSIDLSQPEGKWSPMSIAIFHGNGKMLEELTASSRSLLGDRADSVQLTGKRHGGYWCNGCLHDIYGPRFCCRTCPYTDYCFMCKPFLGHLHENHEWDFVESYDEPSV